MWLAVLTDAYTDGENAEDIFKYEEKVSALTTKDIQAVAKKYLSGDKITAILMPEK
ncbi:hypothetical protein [Flavobacterium album]|uniref:hypothetical protein n=1 Tax=Flavobacterium album TaxID=2175091 RepID=UPI0015E81543|nr:hypothetical protein [Flavobacterium album]